MQTDGRRTDATSSAAFAGRGSLRGLRKHVLWQLGLDIVSGHYPPDAILPVDTDIPKRFGVSRTVIREATNALAAKGLIEARARIGTRVLPRRRWNMFDADVLAWHFEAGPDAAFLRNLAEIRLGIEVEATILASERRTEAQADALMACVARMALAEVGDTFAREDLEFHRLVAEASDNPFMASITGLVEVALASTFRMSSPADDPAALAFSVAQHRRVAEAIVTRDAKLGREAMADVIRAGQVRAVDRLPPPGANLK